MRYEANDKQSVRSRVLSRRASRSTADQVRAERDLCATALTVPEVGGARTVACYIAMPGEPRTGMLLAVLRARGSRVIVPVLYEDGDLDWASYDDEANLVPSLKGTRSPIGHRLGVAAIAGADAVLVPGLAADSSGVRLGRGGGSYDRALARVPPRVFTAVLLYDDELVDTLPHEPHDERVTAAITPSRLIRFR
jgi:5-formyltetrahydrofolate cyclo-ligase